jgi:transposase
MQSISNISESEKEENNRQIDASRKQVKDMLERFRKRGLELCNSQVKHNDFYIPKSQSEQSKDISI